MQTRSVISSAVALATLFSSSPAGAQITMPFASYNGGSGDEIGEGLAVDAAGHVYVCGATPGLPTSGACPGTALGAQDVFVRGIDPTLMGSLSLKWSTVFGGSGLDNAVAAAVSGTGQLAIVGVTFSIDFPIVLGMNQGNGAACTFVALLDPATGCLTYSTVVASGGAPYGVAFDAQGRIWVAGATMGFPGAQVLGSRGQLDAFVMCIDPSIAGPSSVVMSLQIGGDELDAAYDIAVQGQLVSIAGITMTSTTGAYPTTPGAIQSVGAGGTDGFLTVFSMQSASLTLDYSTFIGGVQNDSISAIAPRGASELAFVGYTTSMLFGQSTPPLGSDIMLGCTDPSVAGTAGLRFGKVFGGSANDIGTDITVTPSGDLVCYGYTNSTDYPVTSNALQSTLLGPSDQVVSTFIPLGPHAIVLGSSTYFGGSGADNNNSDKQSVAWASSGVLWTTGTTTSTDLASVGAPNGFDLTSNGLKDAFVVGLSGDLLPPVTQEICFGDGTGTACACGNSSNAGSNEGCLHAQSIFAGGGGKLRASGTARVSTDSLCMQASQLPPGTTALLFQGTQMHQAGLGAQFGDGLLCVSGSTLRIEVKSAPGGVISFGACAGSSIAQVGLASASGGLRGYQVWFRDSDQSFCTPSTFNLTNAVMVQWRL